MKTAKSNENSKAFYSPYVISGDKMYISGQLPIKDGVCAAVPGGVKAQTNCALNNIEAQLLKENLNRSNVIMCRIYVTDINNWDIINEAYAEFFGNHKPARAVIPVSPLLFNCKLEIEAVAEITQ